ncbi:MAG: SOS response-associated peptidase family protein, partial [Actinomycetes bacterium]
EPNQLVEPIHNRMPAILADRDQMDGWLDPTVDARAAVALLKPLDPGRMQKAKAARAVGKPGNEGPALLHPEQDGLF